MSAVAIVRGARAFGAHHRRAQRIFGRAAPDKRRAIRRLLQSFQDLRADALRRFLDVELGDAENFFRVVRGKLGTNAQSAPRDLAEAAPFLIRHLENALHHFLRGKIAGARDRADVLVFQFEFSALELLHEHENGFEQIHGLETADNNRHAEFLNEFLIVAAAHHRADVSRRDKCLARDCPAACSRS